VEITSFREYHVMHSFTAVKKCGGGHLSSSFELLSLSNLHRVSWNSFTMKLQYSFIYCMPKDLKMPVIFTCFFQLVAFCIFCVGVKLGVRKRGAEVLIWV
jgi:hypothetical protein